LVRRIPKLWAKERGGPGRESPDSPSSPREQLTYASVSIAHPQLRDARLLVRVICRGSTATGTSWHAAVVMRGDACTKVLGWFLGSVTMLAMSAAETGPWRMSRALDLPEWLDIRGEQRTRYETLDGQFRAGRTGGDQALAMRTSLSADLKLRPVGVFVEGMDSRQYLSDSGSPIDTTMVDTVELLQAHARWHVSDWIAGGTNTIRVGRETLDLGMRRLVARNAFRNTINSFTGIDWLWQARGGGSVRAFWFLPMKRVPDDTASLLDNDLRWNSESLDTHFWGLYGELPALPAGVRAEVYWLGLAEEPAVDTRRRHLQTPGFRVYRNAAPGRWDFEVESTYQFGTSRARAGLAERDLTHFAFLQHGAAGYTFDAMWKPRVGVRYDYASGDAHPTDSSNGRFDTLYGARRFEFGPTGIYGAVGRANLNSPEIVASVKPIRNVETSVGWRWVWLAEARDAWTTGNIRDITGASGTEVGQQLELRVRWDALPGNLRLETGMAHLFAGEFLRRAPNSTHQGDVNYVFTEATWQF